jgi:putative peptidoglycan lipid II flippase
MSSSTKKSMLKSAAGIGGLSLLGKILGIIREILKVSFLGVGAVSDAFVTAYKIPNSLRKIFAEGALSAAMVPTFVSIVHTEGKDMVDRLMTLAFLVFEGALLLLCALVMWQAKWVVLLFAPGFSPLQVHHTVPYLQILMPFIFFLSSSALLAGALQSVRHFFVPAFSPILLNIVFIGSLFICITNTFPVEVLCWAILFGGFLQLVLHFIVYKRMGFEFKGINKQAWIYFQHVMTKFLPCLLSMSVVEIGLIVDTAFASYLREGSISLVTYGHSFMTIPLSVVAVSLSTVLLPHLSRIVMYAPQRLGFYVLEASKFIMWICLPVIIMMGFLAEKIFLTLFLSKRFTIDQVSEAGAILLAFLVGLFFFCMHKILLNMYYAKHNTWIPTVVSLVGVCVNMGLNFVFMRLWGSMGLALGTSISFAIQVTLLILFLRVKFRITLYWKQFLRFLGYFCVQLVVIFPCVYGLYKVGEHLAQQLPQPLAHFFLEKVGFWLWTGPLCATAFLLIFLTRKLFKVRVYFLD